MKCDKCGAECNVISITDRAHICSCTVTSFGEYTAHEVVDEIQARLPEDVIVEVENAQTFKFINKKTTEETLVTIEEVDMFLHYLQHFVANM